MCIHIYIKTDKYVNITFARTANLKTHLYICMLIFININAKHTKMFTRICTYIHTYMYANQPHLSSSKASEILIEFLLL